MVTPRLVMIAPALSMRAAYVTVCAVLSVYEKDATPAALVVAVPMAVPSAVNVTKVSGRGLPLASLRVAFSVKAVPVVTSEGPVRVSVGGGLCEVMVMTWLVMIAPALSMRAAYVTVCAVLSVCEKDATPAALVVAVPMAVPSAVNVTNVSGRGLPLASLRVAFSVKAVPVVTSEGPVRVSVGGGDGVGVGVGRWDRGLERQKVLETVWRTNSGVGVAVASGVALADASGTLAPCVVSAALVLTMLNAPLP